MADIDYCDSPTHVEELHNDGTCGNCGAYLRYDAWTEADARWDRVA